MFRDSQQPLNCHLELRGEISGVRADQPLRLYSQQSFIHPEPRRTKMFTWHAVEAVREPPFSTIGLCRATRSLSESVPASNATLSYDLSHIVKAVIHPPLVPPPPTGLSLVVASRLNDNLSLRCVWDEGGPLRSDQCRCRRVYLSEAERGRTWRRTRGIKIRSRRAMLRNRRHSIHAGKSLNRMTEVSLSINILVYENEIAITR